MNTGNQNILCRLRSSKRIRFSFTAFLFLFVYHILYAQDTNGEDLITLFLAARITTASQVAGLLDLSPDQFQDLLSKRLLLDNESIAEAMGIKIERVYKLRSQAGKRLRNLLSQVRIKI